MNNNENKPLENGLNVTIHFPVPSNDSDASKDDEESERNTIERKD